MKKLNYNAPEISIFTTGNHDVISTSPVTGSDVRDNWMDDVFDLT